MTIPFQQVSLEARQSFVNRLVATFGKARGSLWLFPTPDTIATASIEDLRAAGLSTAKAMTLQHAASLIVAGSLNEADIDRLPSDEALRLLDDLPGIGPWTAGVVLLRGFGRLDVFPHGDVGARRTLSRLLGGRNVADGRRRRSRPARAARPIPRSGLFSRAGAISRNEVGRALGRVRVEY